MLAVLLRHLPADAQQRQRVLDCVDSDAHVMGSVRSADVVGHTAVSLACLDRSPEGAAPDAALPVVRLLLEAGASPNIPVRYSRSSALNEACAGRQPRPELVRLLVEKNANVDQRTSHGGWTALHTAAEYGDVHTVLQLAEMGAGSS